MALGETIRDVILRITGEGDDARRELERLSLDLTKFGQKDVEASAEIDTAKAKTDLEALEKQFGRIDGRDLTATANVRLGKAMGELAALQAVIDELDGKDVDIDINVKKDLGDRLQALGGDAAHFADKLGDLEKRSKGAGESIADTNVNFFNMNSRLGTLAKALPALIPILVGFVAQIVAVGASAVEAAGGLGALAIAAGGAFVVSVGFGIAAIARFKETMEEAGSPAHKIVEIVEQIGGAMKPLLEATDPVLEAIAKNLGGVLDVIKTIEPAFTKFGKAAGEAVGWVINALTSSEMAKSIATLIELSGPVLKPVVKILAFFGEILLDIANATMPLLTAALQKVAKWLGSVADKTKNIGELRKGIGGMVEHLESWVNLLWQVAGVFKEIVRIAAPFGKAIVDKLAEGAEHLKEWLSSKGGTERVQQFFEDVLPLASEIAKAVGKIIIIFLQFGQLMAPVLKPVISGLNEFLDLLIGVLELLLKIPAPIRGVIGTIASLVGGLGKAKVAGEGMKAAMFLVISALGVLGGSLGIAWDAVKEFIGGVPGFFKDKFTAAWEFVTDIGGKIVDAAGNLGKNVLDAVVGFVKDLPGKIGDFFSGVRDRVQAWVGAAGNAAANVGRAVLHGVVSFVENLAGKVGDFFSAAKDKIEGWGDNLKNAAQTVGKAILNGVGDFVSNIAGKVGDALGAAKKQIEDWVDNLKNAAINAGEAVANGIVTGVGKLTGLLDKALSAAGGIAADVGNAIRDWVNANTLFGDKIHIGLPGPVPDIDFTMPALAKGVRDFFGGMALVGEQGPEIVNLPAGADVFTAADSRRILERMARGQDVAGAGGSQGTVIEQLNVTPMVAGGSPDPYVFAAQLSLALRAKGGA